MRRRREEREHGPGLRAFQAASNARANATSSVSPGASPSDAADSAGPAARRDAVAGRPPPGPTTAAWARPPRRRSGRRAPGQSGHRAIASRGGRCHGGLDGAAGGAQPGPVSAGHAARDHARPAGLATWSGGVDNGVGRPRAHAAAGRSPPGQADTTGAARGTDAVQRDRGAAGGGGGRGAAGAVRGPLREARLAAGLTQEALAERAGVTVRGLQRPGAGRRRRPQRDTRAAPGRGPGAARRRSAPRSRRRAPRRPARAARAAGRADRAGAGAGPPAAQPAPAADQLRRAGAGAGRGARRLLARAPPGDADRRRRGCGKTRLALAAAGATLLRRRTRTASGWSSWRRWPIPALVPQARGRGAGRARGARPAAAGDARRRACAPSACCWCWTTASTCSTPARRWPTRCCAAAPACASWPPAGSRWASPARRRGRCRRWRVPDAAARRARRTERAPGTRRCACSSSAPRRRGPASRSPAENAPAVAAICAAAGRPPAGARAGRRPRARAARPSSSLARLDDRFRLLTGGQPHGRPRGSRRCGRRSTGATTCSTEPEQALFRRLWRSSPAA